MGGRPLPALCLRAVGVAWVRCASLGGGRGGGGRHGLVFLLNVWEAFHFAALWAPFVERAGFRAISAVCGVLDSLGMGAFCVALGCVVRGYRMCDCFHGIVEFHYFTNTSVILTKYIICLWGPVLG